MLLRNALGVEEMQNFQKLEDKIQEGYCFSLTKNTLEACKVWSETWELFIQLTNEKKTRSLQAFDHLFNTQGYIGHWIPDMVEELEKAVRKDADIQKIRLQIYEDYVKNYGEDNTQADILKILRKMYCEALFALGNHRKSEEHFMMWLKKEPSWTEGWLSWAYCWTEFAEGTKRELQKAASILLTALNQKQLAGGRMVVYEKLLGIYQKLQDEEKVEEIKKQMMACWGEEAALHDLMLME